MNLDPLPHDLEQSINRFARDQHPGRGEAVLKLIEAGLKVKAPKNTIERSQVQQSARSNGDLAAANSSRQARNAARRAKRAALVKARPDTPDVLIGYLADDPDTAENIRRLAYDRRIQAFGSP